VKRFVASDILRSNFVIDWERTKFHHPVPGTGSEGSLLISDNYVVLLNEQRAAAPEYAQFRGMRCEVQIQTTLNHAWAEMEHEVYKVKLTDGFGTELLDGIKSRFRKVMREMLIPAGHEFQHIADDYIRLASGRELFGQGSLKALAPCTDNNQRHDLLERFRAHVLPHLDDPSRAHAEIRAALVAAMQAARTTKTKAIETPWGELRGKTVEDVVDLGMGILDHLRYTGLDATEGTFDALCELFPDTKSDKECERLLASVKSLAGHNVEVWRVGGPVIQDMLVRKMAAWDAGTREGLRAVVLTVLEQVLRPEATGTSATYKTVTWTTAEVVPSDALTRIRSTSLDLLEELFRSAQNDTERREVKQVLLDATRFPQRGGAESALQLTILQNSARVARFFVGVSDTLSHELLQTLEHSFLWLYRHTRRPPTAPPEEPNIAAARQAFIDAIFAFRDRINANREFVVYKTLVGFESVFPGEWEGDPMDFQAEEAYRNARITELVAEVNEANADAWLKTMQRCASTKSNDLATFPSFGRFAQELASSKPAIVESYLDRLGVDLANFLPGMLNGMEATDRWPAAKQRIDGWLAGRRYLSQILWYQRFSEKVDVAMIEYALNLAIEEKDDGAVLNAAQICAARTDRLPSDKVGQLFTTAVGYFNNKADARWANAIWAGLPRSTLVDALSTNQIDLVLAALVHRPEVDHQVEYILVPIAKRFPEKVIDYFGARLKYKKDDDSVVEYDAVPFSFMELAPHLAGAAKYIVSKSLVWHREDREMFQYRGGRLLSITFTEFTPELEALLKETLLADAAGAARFVVDVLAGYHGLPATHETYKAIVETVQPNDPILGSIEIGLDATGVVSGEFGMVEAYKRKKEELQPWLTDARPRVRAFAQSHDKTLDRMIAAEQRRSEDDLEARKRQYGDDPGSATGK
jgi:hypothetical protein